MGGRALFTDTGYSSRCRCHDGDRRVETRGSRAHRHRDRADVHGQIELSDSDVESDSGDFHRRKNATTASRHATPVEHPRRVTEVTRKSQCIVHRKTMRVGHRAREIDTSPMLTGCTRRSIGIGLRRSIIMRVISKGDRLRSRTRPFQP